MSKSKSTFHEQDNYSVLWEKWKIACTEVAKITKPNEIGKLVLIICINDESTERPLVFACQLEATPLPAPPSEGYRTIAVEPIVSARRGTGLSLCSSSIIGNRGWNLSLGTLHSDAAYVLFCYRRTYTEGDPIPSTYRQKGKPDSVLSVGMPC